MREQTLAPLITDMPDDDLRAARRDAATGLSLIRPGSPMYGPAHAYLGLLDAELAQRHGAGQHRRLTRVDPEAKDNPMIHMPAPDDAAQIAAFLDSHTGWSAFWDKREGVWRVAEDDPNSDLYAEHADARTVIAYATAHS